jgi:hypothetical protein
MCIETGSNLTSINLGEINMRKKYGRELSI